MRLRVTAVELFERDVLLRMPFRFGVVTLTQAPQAFARVRIRVEDGREAEGAAAELLVPKWFDKDAALSYLKEHRRKSITPMRLIEWDGGMSVHQPSCIHNATSPVLAYKRAAGNPVQHAPENRGDDGTRHYRHDSSTRCMLDDTVLRYRGSRYFRDLDLQLPPRAAWTRFVEIGGYAGFIDHLNPNDPPPPPPPTEPEEDDDDRSWIERMGL